MKAKLTLNIDNLIVAEAQKYAKLNNTSISNIIENYLYSLTFHNRTDIKVSPLVESLTGVIPVISEDINK